MKEKETFLHDKYDVCGGANYNVSMIYDASTPKGTCPLYKTLYTNSCTFDCKYCNLAKNAKTRRDSFSPEELAKSFMNLVYTKKVEGLFLSSSVSNDSDKVTEKMIESVKLIRNKYNYEGYVHFKVLPGVSYDLIKQASELVERMSVNIESTSKSRLDDLSSNKDYNLDLVRRQFYLKKLNVNQTTQMVIGASDETDLEVLKTIKFQNEELNQKRIYFSAFKPVKNSELENKEPTPLYRQNRLYNVDFLMRKYNFKFDEFKNILVDDMLPNKDPKFLIAKNYFDKPIDINEASEEELLRVPGIGPKITQNIIEIRKKEKLNTKKDLMKTRIILKRAMPFLKINGYSQINLNKYL
ncbi:MAG: helix-hairpin-helix domain-containing protein [Candidatus Nanoarchaeia archaeon]|nr:helix-hairpin-helix domain-containing protein [Candidatus Nanoarchaeia archaeon]